MNELEKERSSGGNAHSNTPGSARPGSPKGEVKAPAPPPAEANKNAPGFEGTPPFSKETLSGDGFSRANAKARQMYATRK